MQRLRDSIPPQNPPPHYQHIDMLGIQSYSHPIQDLHSCYSFKNSRTPGYPISNPLVLIPPIRIHQLRISNAGPIEYPTFDSLIGQELVNFASIILLPPIPLTFSTSSPLTSNASTSSPPPILFPLISTFGTVLLPVLFSKCFCSWGPKGWLSSSTTKGAGTIVYLSSRIDFALRE